MKSKLESEEIQKLRKGISEVSLKVRYTGTYESLDAIMAGLDLKPEDNVLAIAGSGDQAFAMLEYRCKVTAVDTNACQIEYFKLRVNALKQYGLFLPQNRETTLEKIIRKKYCWRKKRLNQIRANLENLTILKPSDILKLPTYENFSKVYLSNALDKPHHAGNPEEALVKIGQTLPVGGLVYISRELSDSTSVKGFEIVEKLTSEAKRHENDGYCWRPIVYRKVESAK